MNSLSRRYLQSLRDMFEVHIEDNTSDVIGNKDRISQIKEKKITLDDILRDWEGEDLSAYDIAPDCEDWDVYGEGVNCDTESKDDWLCYDDDTCESAGWYTIRIRELHTDSILQQFVEEVKDCFKANDITVYSIAWKIHEWVDTTEQEVVGTQAECEISYESDGREFFKYMEVNGSY